MVYMENEGALFRGPRDYYMTEVFSTREQIWKPYTGIKSKPGYWGNVLSQEELEKEWPEAL
ncbi:MAG: hypothetical protein AAB680_04200 [Pseudomonadota bacterium]